MALPQYVNVSARLCAGPKMLPIEVPVSAEYEFTLSVNGDPFAPIICSGSDLRLLALGQLAAEGMIRSADEVLSITVDEASFSIDVRIAESEDAHGRIFRARPFARGVRPSPAREEERTARRAEVPRVRASVVMTGMNEFLNLSKLHNLTHGVHSAALYSVEGERLCFFDEIGRHNAIDKALGFALENGIGLDRVMIFSTGRMAGEIVQKAVALSAPVLVSRAAPTTRGVELARRAGMLLICGVRASGFHVFSGEGFVEC